jgi:hypothetical protein
MTTLVPNSSLTSNFTMNSTSAGDHQLGDGWYISSLLFFVVPFLALSVTFAFIKYRNSIDKPNAKKTPDTNPPDAFVSSVESNEVANPKVQVVNALHYSSDTGTSKLSVVTEDSLLTSDSLVTDQESVASPSSPPTKGRVLNWIKYHTSRKIVRKPNYIIGKRNADAAKFMEDDHEVPYTGIKYDLEMSPAENYEDWRTIVINFQTRNQSDVDDKVAVSV